MQITGSPLDKLLEKIVNAPPQKYISMTNVLHIYQFGFRKRKSTSHAVFKLVTDLFEAIDNKCTPHL